MTDTRRTITWMVFLFSLVMIWDAWNRHNGHPTFLGMEVAPPAAASASGAASNAAQLPTPAQVGTTAAAGASAPGAVSAGLQAAPGSAAPSTGEAVVVTTQLVRATFDTLGGSLVRMELLKYPDADQPDQPVVLFDRGASHTYLAQTGLVGAAAWPSHLTPLRRLPGETKLAEGQDRLVVAFESDALAGVKLVKTYTFHRDSYAVEVKHEVVNVGNEPVSPQVYLQLVRDGSVPASVAPSFIGGPQSYTGPALYTANAHYQKVAFSEIDEKQAEFEKQADNGWVAMVQHYFASAWLHQAVGTREFFARKLDNGLYAVGMVLPIGTLQPGETKRLESTLFAGPQEEKKLEALAPGLELVKDYTWTAILAKPLFWLLDFIHGWVGNWGWAIVLLVVLLKAAFYWLNASAYRSMAKMKAISPKVMELRERLKDNPQQMQQEMMRIYREEKVNPLGGCLPILVQIPVFIALYSVLLASVEMRNAPWIGWIKDLSALDPYYVLPALMTASTLLQTWLNPTPPDPMQAKLMWIMPMVFSVMFFFFPAGLVLYWLTNNILSIAQQWMINRQLGVQN